MSLYRALAVVTAAVAATVVAAPTSLAAPPEHAGKHIVVLRDSVTDPGAVAAEHGKRYGATVSYVYGKALKGYAATVPDSRVRDIERDSRVLFVGADRPVEATAQTLPSGIDRIDADASSQLSGNHSGAVTDVSNVAVAVIDTGSGPHADLNVVGGTNCSTGRSYNDGNGHGTHVAGTIGARDDGAGVVGVAPGVPIYSVRVLNNQGSGSWSSVACGIDWVTANAAAKHIKIASMSLGGPGSDDGNCGNTNKDALHKAICNSVAAGVTYVIAAGNDGANLSGFTPGAYDEALTVTAVADYNGQPGGGAASTCRAGTDDTPADFSNFATPGSADAAHTIAAPGVCINSTWKGGSFKTISGTSMATPHVSGLAALCIASGYCSTTPSSVRSRLMTDAAAQPAGYGFAGDAHTSGGTRYYGYMAYAGGY